MILKELFYPESVSKKFGGFAFGTDIFEEKERTPHYEMDQSMDLFDTRPLINSGVRQITRFIIGNKLTVNCDDEWSTEFLKKWLDLRPMFIYELENGVLQALITGNAYVEEIYNEIGGKRVFDGLDIFPDASKVYVNLWNRKDNLENYYIIKLPMTVYSFMNKQSSRYLITYFAGDRVFKESIWGVAFPKGKFHHLKCGFSRNSTYGRSYVSSVIDDATVLHEIIKNLAIVSRYRALNSKIIMPGSEQEDIIEDDLEYARQEFQKLVDGSHLFLNKKYDIQSFTNKDEYDTLINEIDFLRKEIGSGLVPNYLTSFNSDVNRATSQEAKIPFMLEIEYLQNYFENFFSKIIVNGLRKTYPKLSPNARIKFGNIEMEVKSEKVQYYQQLYTTGVITMNELREIAGLEKVNGGDKYSWQINVPEEGNAMAIANKV